MGGPSVTITFEDLSRFPMSLAKLLPGPTTPCLECHHDLEDHALTVGTEQTPRGPRNHLVSTCRLYVPNVTKDDVDPCDCQGFRWAP